MRYANPDFGEIWRQNVFIPAHGLLAYEIQFTSPHKGRSFYGRRAADTKKNCKVTAKHLSGNIYS